MLFRFLKLSRFYHPMKRLKSARAPTVDRCLLFTNTFIASNVSALGDLIQQEIEYRNDKLPKRYVWRRTGNMALIGLCVGFVNHIAYNWINRLLPQKSIRSVGRKILMDQCVMSPISITFLILGLNTLEGRSFQNGLDDLKNKFLEIYKVDCCVWPPAQFINFYFLPVKYQVIYMSVIAALYNVYLSFIMHKDEDWSLKRRAKSN